MFFRKKAFTGWLSRCLVHLTADNGIAASTYQKLQFDNVEYDENDEFDDVTNDRFTAKEKGKYLVTCNIQWKSWEAGKEAKFDLRLSGATKGRVHRWELGTDEWTQLMVRVYELDVDDYIEIWLWHDNASAKLIDSSTYATFLAVNRIG